MCSSAEPHCLHPHRAWPTVLDADDVDDLDEAPEGEVEAVEEEVLDQATAAATLAELKIEIATLGRLESLAAEVRRSGQDTKWRELSQVLGEVFTTAGLSRTSERGGRALRFWPDPKARPSPRQKLVIFTEHRDTLNYLERQITSSSWASQQAVVTIHGGVGREERRKAQESFLHDPEVQVLLATDAAGEGINLQRAHLMVNYDLPWNPNRMEQRFGRIHRIGQTEVCHLWNLVASRKRARATSIAAAREAGGSSGRRWAARSSTSWASSSSRANPFATADRGDPLW
jgi:superfamily II DNA/RNA helicase